MLSSPALWFVGAGVLTGTLTGASAALAVPTFEPEVLNVYPHDSAAFTQGLVYAESQLFESTGLYGSSTLRRVQLESGDVVQQVALNTQEFGEGLALVGNQLVQLTWQSGRAHIYDRESFQAAGEFTYDGEGWGLCFDGTHLIMSDGSSSLFFRNPSSFEVERRVVVTVDGESRDMLNELECVDDFVYANVWQTDLIVRIDKRDGIVTDIINASALLSSEERAQADVLNGIAYIPEAQTFLLTGKLWPKMFEARLFPPAASVPPTRPLTQSSCAIVRAVDQQGLRGLVCLALLSLWTRRRRICQ